MSDTHAAVEAVWRIESGRLVAALARITGDFAGAEDLAQDALERALAQWPTDGIPNHPASWLMATAKHVAVDRYRRQLNLATKLAAFAQEQITATSTEGDPMATVDDALTASVPDDMLRLIFTACHPALSLDSQVALTLRTVAGLRTPEIAQAFLVPEATIGQRISRAKRTLTDQQVRFELPAARDLPSRLGSVLAVIYLVFNEGYSATAGDDWTRPVLCHDALRLGRVLARLQPDQPEVHGLLALMELQASRIPARTGSAGEPLLLSEQNRGRWDRLHIRRGLAALQAAETLGGGPYTLQAAIAACHARAPSVATTDWERVAALYTVLSYLTPSAVVSLNKAVAVGMADGPERGLALADELQTDPALVAYPQLSAARATFLRQLGRPDEARAAFQRAADLTSNVSQRAIYQRQRDNPRSVHPGGRTMTGPITFLTTIELGGKTATGLPVPEEVVHALGPGRRPSVIVTIGGHTYRSTIASMGGRWLIPLSAENRAAAGVAAGDHVDVGIEADTATRDVAVPDDLATALEHDQIARDFFDSLAYSHRKEWARWIDDAKKKQTRANRLQVTIEALREHKRTR